VTRAREAGFTLVEITAGIVLLGLLLTGVYTVAVGTLRAKNTIDDLSVINTAGPRILDLVEKDLRAAYAHGIKDGKALKAQRQSVAGEEVTIIDLVSTTNSKVTMEVDDRVVRSDVTEVGYRMRRHDDYPRVLELYRREEFFFDDDLLRGGEYYLVYDRMRTLVIDFYEAPDEGTTSSISETEGLEEWDSEDKGGFPRAAKITIELAPPDGIGVDLEVDERRFKFVRWVLFPTAYDKKPQEQQPGDGGPQQPGPGR
jgi:prepilin-type N-terminal cleavage/methylation domain-containing protein